MDDIHIFSPGNVPRDEVVLGVYGAEEWIMADVLRRRHLSGENTIQLDITWITPHTFKLAEWVLENAQAFTFFGADRCVITEDKGFLRVSASRAKMEVEVIGEPKWVQAWVQRIDASFKRAESLIQWVYSTRGDEISVPLNYRPAINSAYPWLRRNSTKKVDFLGYIDDYLASEASVLILIGPPGTGKTTFIKNLVHRSGGNAKVAYDDKVMQDDGLFAGFIDDDSRFLIMEDADAFLSSRSDGNTMMHKFLNVSDGLISAPDKKLVFSTNLPNIRDIDSALRRPGRCFDVIEFRPLTREEAHAVIEETGKGELLDRDRMTLAEIFSQQPNEDARRKTGIGFTA